MILDQNYWENRYKEGTTAWDLGHTSQPLKTIIDKIENKNCSILIPGAGNAYEAEYLIKKGFKNITILDIALHPLELLNKKLNKYSDYRLIHRNYFDHTGSYDVILEQTFFCALEPRFRESYVNKSYELLKDNGRLEGVLFDFKSKRDEPPYSGTKKEYSRLFSKKFEILEIARCLNSEKSRLGKELIIKMKKHDE